MPRGLAVLGLVGGPGLCISGFSSTSSNDSPRHSSMTIPGIVQELSLGIYPVIKGFKPSPVLMRYEAAEAVLPPV
jgi:hypothetical protein